MSAGRSQGPLTCKTCPHACRLRPGEVGRCRARGRREGGIEPLSYGRLTAIAIDPVEKKPLARWNPGKFLVSAGSYGCNLSCPFCQNHGIAQVGADDVDWTFVSPGSLVELSVREREKDPRIVGIAHTYNEPLVAWEYVRDVGLLARRVGLANVLVSNGCVSEDVIAQVAPAIDAANIDLKAFTEEFYRWCGGDLATVRRCIERLAAQDGCHLEVTTLIVPGHNDSADEMRRLAGWLASVDPGIVLHVTRFFPRHRMLRVDPTPLETLRELADVARESLPDVVIGNV